jgi:hypothetical protein
MSATTNAGIPTAPPAGVQAGKTDGAHFAVNREQVTRAAPPQRASVKTLCGGTYINPRTKPMNLDNVIYASGTANPCNLGDDDRRYRADFVPDFTEYDNQPKTICAAFETRGRIWAIRHKKAKPMKRSTSVNGTERISGRVDFLQDRSWHMASPVRRVGRSVFSLAPKSPADHWLQRHGYQQCPF